LDNIGLTGRHYSGFTMIGIQVFNYENDYKFFTEECIEFNYRWLTEFLNIPSKDIFFSEDLWAGGGNMGPCVEYFVDGLELGNMVSM
jgi:alanyl-tRNA synthetase